MRKLAKFRQNLKKMQRFLKNYAVAESDSLVSNDYNWNDLSIGNDTLGADTFFGNF